MLSIGFLRAALVKQLELELDQWRDVWGASLTSFFLAVDAAIIDADDL